MTATNHNADYIFHKTLRQQNSFAVMKEKQNINKNCTCLAWKHLIIFLNQLAKKEKYFLMNMANV